MTRTMATESHGQFHANLLSRYSKSCAVLGIIPSEAVCDRLLRNANGVNALTDELNELADAALLFV